LRDSLRWVLMLAAGEWCHLGAISRRGRSLVTSAASLCHNDSLRNAGDGTCLGSSDDVTIR
jgi:hypothetical protein